MSSIIISDVVKILIKDDYLVTHQTEFVRALGVIAATADQNGKLYNSGSITAVNYFTTILIDWTGRCGADATLEKLHDILKSAGFNNIAETLLKTTIPLKTCCWNEQNGGEHFYGRTSKLEELNSLYHTPNSDIVVVCGLPGMGKSELVMKFLNQIQTTDQVFYAWIESTELIDSFKSFAKEVADVNQNNLLSLMKQTSQAVFERYNKKRFIIVFDNCDPKKANDSSLYTLSQSCYHQLMIIITSRVRTCSNPRSHFIDVNELGPDNAKAFVKAVLPQESEKNVSALCDLACNFPIVLQHVAYYVRHQKYNKHSLHGLDFSIEGYVAECKSKNSRMKFGPFSTDPEKAFHKTLKMTLNKLKTNQQLSFQLLDILAFGKPGNFSESLLLSVTKVGGEFIGDMDFFSSITLLKDLCIVKVVGGQGKREIKINPIVQEVIRSSRFSSSDTAGLEKLNKFLTTACTVDQLDPNELKQVSMFWRQVIKYDIAEKDILLKLVHLLLDKLENHCFFYDLLKLSKAATTKFRNLPLYENSQLVLKVIEKYALVLKQFDKLDDAWVEFNYLLCKHNSSGNFESAIESLHDIATIHHLKQEPHKALDCYQDVLSKRQEMYGDQHEKTMVTKANIASMLFETGRFREGKEILDKVIEWQLIKKNDIPRGLHSKHSLGYGYFRQKDYKNARQCFESAMETVDGITLGRVMMLTCQYNLGRTKFFLGYHQDGIEELEAVHKGQVELFGLDCSDANKTKEWIEKFKSKIDPYQVKSKCIGIQANLEQVTDYRSPQRDTDAEPKEISKSKFLLKQELNRDLLEIERQRLRRKQRYYYDREKALEL